MSRIALINIDTQQSFHHRDYWQEQDVPAFQQAMLGLTEGCGDDRDRKVARLVQAIENLKADLNVPGSLREAGIAEADFLERVDLLAEQAFDDQCTGGNPRYPLIDEIRELYLKAYYGAPLASISSMASLPPDDAK